MFEINPWIDLKTFDTTNKIHEEPKTVHYTDIEWFGLMSETNKSVIKSMIK